MRYAHLSYLYEFWKGKGQIPFFEGARRNTENQTFWWDSNPGHHCTEQSAVEHATSPSHQKVCSNSIFKPTRYPGARTVNYTFDRASLSRGWGGHNLKYKAVFWHQTQIHCGSPEYPVVTAREAKSCMKSI